jgi:hypothetical protein
LALASALRASADATFATASLDSACALAISASASFMRALDVASSACAVSEAVFSSAILVS